MGSELLSDIKTVLGILGTVLAIILTTLKLLEKRSVLTKKQLYTGLFMIMGTVALVCVSLLVFWAVYTYAPIASRRCEYVDCTVERVPGVTNILPIVVLDLKQVPPERDFVLENLIRDEIADCGFYPQGNFFKERFFEEGHFLDIYDGRYQMLERLEIHRLVDYLMLAERSKEFIEREGHPIPFTCRARLIYKILDSGGELRRSGTVSAAGAGGTQASAEEEANKKLADKIWQILPSP